MSDLPSDSFPSTSNKRRKTRHNNKTNLPTTRTRTSYLKPAQTMWPPNRLPVELFILIIKYLPRSNIQSMRLVNKEFEEKVSEYLFRVVVVPFKPEIYGINPEPALSGALQGAVMLQDKGMRVFQGFGDHIKKFAMSFEFDENKLANPPQKSDQEAITSFWGIYKWPYKKYNRYAQLEGLEQTADETRTMAKALRFITSAKELGLSIDGGLGWLAGPDINHRVLERGEKPTVFGESRFVPEPKLGFSRNGKASRPSDPTASHSSNSVRAANYRMLVEAGYTGDMLMASLNMMAETEDQSTGPGPTHVLPSDRFHGPVFVDGSGRGVIRLENVTVAANAEDAGPSVAADEDDEDIYNEESLQLFTATPYTGVKSKADNSPPLKPNDLTSAQREMLLEIEWAQRAFMQSYAIAVIDNPFTFKNIESLTIARLPNRHLPILRREDFWDSLPRLKNISLAIIPDWRDVVKLPTSWVQDVKMVPSQSVSGVYQLLREQISHRKNITTLHFEWLCGGEAAPGLFSRNQHILAAPLVCNSMDMVNRGQEASLILTLPHVEHLSLKNCWVSPHVMHKFTLSLRKAALESLTLDSVSMTAPLALNAQPQPLTGHAANAHNLQQLGGQAAANHLMANMVNIHQGLIVAQNGNVVPAVPGVAAIPVAAAVPVTVEEWLDPRLGSWSHIIDVLTPGTTLADIRYTREIGPEPAAREPIKLRKLEFKSCGYARLPLDFDQTVLEPPDVQAPQLHLIAKRINDIESHMMKPMDPTLGMIINHMSRTEVATLENAWHMTVGWSDALADLALEARVDGIANAGRGRFTGVIQTWPSPPPTR